MPDGRGADQPRELTRWGGSRDQEVRTAAGSPVEGLIDLAWVGWLPSLEQLTSQMQAGA